MTRKQIVNLIFLSEKSKNKDSADILLQIADSKTSGRIANSDFIYKINDEENIIPVGRIWNVLLQEATGNTEKAYLNSLEKLVKKYNFPEQLLQNMIYFDNDTNSVKNYVTKDVIF